MSEVKHVIVQTGAVCKIEVKTGLETESVTIKGPATMIVNEVSDLNLSMEQRSELIIAALRGLKRHEWSRIIQNIDMMYSHQAAKVEIDDLEMLRENLQQEFRP